MIFPIESKFYMEGDRLMMQWRGHQYHGSGGGGGGAGSGGGGPANSSSECGGVVDVTAHIEQIVKQAIASKRLPWR